MAAHTGMLVFSKCSFARALAGSEKMVAARKCAFTGAALDSESFSEFVLGEIDGNTSDIGLSDDEDDTTFTIQDEGGEGNDSDSDEADDVEDLSAPDPMTTEIPDSVGGRRPFWKKTLEFFPLPPAPEHAEMPSNAVNLPPHEYVSKYIPSEIFEDLCMYTNQRYLSDTGKTLNSSVKEMRTFMGITVMMSYLKFPRIRMYWARKTRIADNMSRNRYFILRGNLKIRDDNSVNTDDKNTNRFWKIEPIIQSVRNGCCLNPRPQDIAIDEQMIPFWGHVSARQFIKGKPNPCGIKNFVATASDGLPLDFFFYQGRGDIITSDESAKDLDVGGKAVCRLAETLPPGVTIYIDRYFTSVPLLDTLHYKAQAQGTGTIQKGRIPSTCNLKSDSVVKREGRGSIDQAVRNDCQIAIVKWFDNRPVTLISSKEGSEPTDECRRWSKNDGKYILVKRPKLVQSYNKNMGGVDFLDRVISMYRMIARTKKWTVRAIMHLFDFAIPSAWIEYRRDQASLKMPKKDILHYMEFRAKYEEHLIHSDTPNGSCGEQEDELEEPAQKRSKATVPHPPDDVRKKHVSHMPEFLTPVTKNRCRLPGCSANKARVRCTTCKVFLCLQDSRNCFKFYHDL